MQYAFLDTLKLVKTDVSFSMGYFVLVSSVFIEERLTKPGSFYVLLTVHLTIILDNDKLDTQLLYFTIRLF